MSNPYLEDTITRLDATGIKVIRARVGDTQQAFADRLGVSIGTVRAWEQGVNGPGPDVRVKLIHLSRPAVVGRQRASEALRDAANMWDADAIAWEAEGNARQAEQSRQLATKLHEMADNHAAMRDSGGDPYQVAVH